MDKYGIQILYMSNTVVLTYYFYTYMPELLVAFKYTVGHHCYKSFDYYY